MFPCIWCVWSRLDPRLCLCLIGHFKTGNNMLDFLLVAEAALALLVMFWSCETVSPRMMKSWCAFGPADACKIYILLPRILAELSLNTRIDVHLNLLWFCLLVPPAACAICKAVCVYGFLFQGDLCNSPSFQHRVSLILFLASLSSSCPGFIPAGGLYFCFSLVHLWLR